jgi:hypothetical protein
MKNLKDQSLVLRKFVAWLDRSYYYYVSGNPIKFKSGSMYENYMLEGISDLGFRLNDFSSNSSAGLVKAFLLKLDGSQSYQRRSPKGKSDITSAFKAFIKFRAVTAS